MYNKDSINGLVQGNIEIVFLRIDTQNTAIGLWALRDDRPLYDPLIWLLVPHSSLIVSFPASRFSPWL